MNERKNAPVPEARTPYGYTTASAAATQQLGHALGKVLQAGDVVLLHGDLGAGKTTFTQGIAQGLGIDEPVTSPTFTLIREYEGHLMLYHVDLYRIGGTAEAADLGLEEYLSGTGVCVIEWPERAAPLFAGGHLSVTLHAPFQDDRRTVTFSATGPRFEARLQTLARSLHQMENI